MAAEKKKAIRSIEELTEQYQQLNEKKIQTQTQLDEATKQLEALQKEAVAEFETCDIEELKAKLKQMESENETRRSKYQELLQGIADDLANVEQEAATEAKQEKDE
jgi:hypothetical protein